MHICIHPAPCTWIKDDLGHPIHVQARNMHKCMHACWILHLNQRWLWGHPIHVQAMHACWEPDSISHACILHGSYYSYNVRWLHAWGHQSCMHACTKSHMVAILVLTLVPNSPNLGGIYKSKGDYWANPGSTPSMHALENDCVICLYNIHTCNTAIYDIIMLSNKTVKTSALRL